MPETAAEPSLGRWSVAAASKARNRGFLKQPLIAFGDASTVSTGFGYAPAPQARLRHRLQTMHKAFVTIIHEFRTSVMCHECHGPLE